MKTDHILFGRQKYTPIRTQSKQSNSLFRKTGNSVFQKTGENLFGQYSRERSTREKAYPLLPPNIKDFQVVGEEIKSSMKSQGRNNYHLNTSGGCETFGHRSPQPTSNGFRQEKQRFTPNIYNSFNLTKGSKFFPQPRSSSFSDAKACLLPAIQNRNQQGTIEDTPLWEAAGFSENNDLLTLLNTQKAIRKNLPPPASRQSTALASLRVRTAANDTSAKEDFISDDSPIMGVPFVLVHGSSEVIWLFNCQICDNLVLEPVRCERCQTLFCRKCIKNTCFQNRGNCPSCNNQFVPDKVDPQTLQILAKVESDCPNKEFGCKKILKYEEFEQHASTCPKKKYNCRRCQKSVLDEELGEHAENCLEFPVSCQKCQKSLPRKDFEMHRDTDCMNYMVNTMIYTNKSLAGRIDRLEKQLYEKDKQIVELQEIFQQQGSNTGGTNNTQPELISVNVSLTQNHPRVNAEEVESSAVYTCKEQIVNDFKAFLGAPICLTDPYPIHCKNKLYLNFKFPKLSGDAIIGLQFLDGITNNNALSLDNHGKAIEMKLVDDVWKCIARDDITSIQFQEGELIQLSYNPFNISITISNLTNQSCVSIQLEKFVIGSSEFVFLSGLFRKDDQVAFMLPSSQTSSFQWKLD